MKIKNAALMAKIASGQILPGICKNFENHKNEEKQEEKKEVSESEKVILRRLYNKNFSFMPAKSTEKNGGETDIAINEETQNKLVYYLHKSKEPNITVCTNDDIEFNETNETVITPNKKEIAETKNKQSENNNINNKTNNKFDDTNIVNKEKAHNVTKRVVNKEVEQEKVNNQISNGLTAKTSNDYKELPLPKKKFAYESGSDIILKGNHIVLGINKCGLIGTCSNLSNDIKKEMDANKVGILFNGSEFLMPLFKNQNQNLNFNSIKIVYKSKSDTKTVTNVNLYDTQETKSNYLSKNTLKNYESLIPNKNYDVCADDILSSETIGKSKDISHTISYSFRNNDNKISINVTLANLSNETLQDLKYYYAINFNIDNNIGNGNILRLKTSPHETGILCFDENSYDEKGIYLRTKENNSFVFIDKEWDWLYGDKWDKIKLPQFMEIDRKDFAISGLAFNKKELKPKQSWSINFSIGFSNENDFLRKEFAFNPVGLNFYNSNFSHKLLHNIITNCGDFTNCDLTGADLSHNSLDGAKTGPLAPESGPPSKLPVGYKFVDSGTNKYIIGPNVVLTNCDLSNIDFTNMNLSNSDFTGSKLSNCVFSNTNLTGVKISNNHNNNISFKFSEYKLRDGFILGPKLIYEHQNFLNKDLSDINFSDCKFYNCNFSFANLSNTNFTNCEFFNIVPGPFTHEQVQNIFLPTEYTLVELKDNLVCIAGPKVNFTDFDLSYSSLANVDLSNVNFTNTIMFETNLLSSKLDNSITGPVICEENNLILPDGYYLVSSSKSDEKYIVGPRVNLTNKDLSHLNLSHIDLSDSKFIFSDMSYTNLTKTNLENTCLPLIIGPLDRTSNNPINYQKTMSMENFDGTKWLIYKWEHYKWDIYSSQLHNMISKN